MRFEILGPNSEVAQVIETSANPIRIGKVTNGNDVVLDNDSVGRKHAKLEVSSAGFKLSAEDVSKQTLVNGQKVAPFKPVMVEDGAIMTFGQVQVRLVAQDSVSLASTDDLGTEEEEAESGSTLAMPAPSLEDIEAGIANSGDIAAAPAAPAAPPAAPPASAAPAAPPSAPKPSQPPAPAAKPAAFGGGFGGGAFSQSTPAAPPTKIIKKKKRPVSFERRFLSARGKSNKCVLEVAMVWKDTVLSVQEYKPENGSKITVGSDNSCNYRVDLNTPSKCILVCTGGRWQLIFNNADEGFVLQGDKKTLFHSASNAEFQVPSLGGSAGSLACMLDGDIRAKFIFGDVSILVHYVDSVPVAFPIFGNLSASNYGGFIASLLIHFALFSVILFATDRVDALMIDRILTASRFASVVTPPEEEPEEEEKPDEEEPEEEEQPEEDPDIAKDAPDTPFAANTPSNSDTPSNKSGMSKSEAIGAAQATGLLAQSNAMNSMLAAGLDMQNLDNLDWSSFDANAQASAAGYGLGTTGTGGGAAGLGGFGGGGFGPGGAGGSGAIRAAGSNYNANLGTKGEAKPAVKMKNPEVTGSLDKRIIQKVVRQHSGELRACYEKELSKVKGLNGRVVVVWIISPQGAVTKALVKESTIKNKNVEQCVVNSVKFWRFPAPKGGGLVQIEYPFVFELSSN